MKAKRSRSIDSWRFQRLVRGYLWTRDNPAEQFRCLLIIWSGDGETWDAAAALHQSGSRLSETFESHNSAVLGFDQCFAWLRQFTTTYGLPPLGILEEWARMLKDASGGRSDQKFGPGGLRLN